MSGAASEPSLIYLLACMAGVRKERGRGRGRKLDHETTRSRALKFPLPPSPSPFNACHAGYLFVDIVVSCSIPCPPPPSHAKCLKTSRIAITTECNLSLSSCICMRSTFKWICSEKERFWLICGLNKVQTRGWGCEKEDTRAAMWITLCGKSFPVIAFPWTFAISLYSSFLLESFRFED